MLKNKVFKFLTIKFIILIIIKYYNNQFQFNKFIINRQRELNLTFPEKIQKKIRIGIYTLCMKNGGRARITAILINSLYKFQIFNIFLYTQKTKEKHEYSYPKKVKRSTINLYNITKILRNKIDILIFNMLSYRSTKIFNGINKIKIIYYLHNSIFSFIYSDYYAFFKLLYKEYAKSKYIISLIPFENDFLFKKFGINSIIMNNFVTYNYKRIIPSDLSSKIILMIGRGNNKNKNFEKGIRSMEYITQVIQDCKLKIISELFSINNLINLIHNLNLKNNIKIEGFKESSSVFFKNASLHFFPSIAESFGLVLCETKMYGIPNILLGLDYISNSRNGTIIIYDDTPESLAKEAIIILLDKKYRKYLGKESRKNMKSYNNEQLTIEWVNLILNICKNDSYYYKFKSRNLKMTDKEALLILNKQNHILKIRKNKNINFIENLTLTNY